MRLFRIKASETLEKSLAGSIYKEEKGETETKRTLDYLRMLNHATSMFLPHFDVNQQTHGNMESIC